MGTAAYSLSVFRGNAIERTLRLPWSRFSTWTGTCSRRSEGYGPSPPGTIRIPFRRRSQRSWFGPASGVRRRSSARSACSSPHSSCWESRGLRNIAVPDGQASMTSHEPAAPSSRSGRVAVRTLLSRWRAAERRLRATPEDAPHWQSVAREYESARLAYLEATQPVGDQARPRETAGVPNRETPIEG
jgi:hypothetical protein